MDQVDAFQKEADLRPIEEVYMVGEGRSMKHERGTDVGEHEHGH